MEPLLELTGRAELDEAVLAASLDQLVRLDDTFLKPVSSSLSFPHSSTYALLKPLSIACGLVEGGSLGELNGLDLLDEIELLQRTVEELLSAVLAHRFCRHDRCEEK